MNTITSKEILSIIVPVYNEQETVEIFYDTVKKHTSQLKSILNFYSWMMALRTTLCRLSKIWQSKMSECIMCLFLVILARNLPSMQACKIVRVTT